MHSIQLEPIGFLYLWGKKTSFQPDKRQLNEIQYVKISRNQFVELNRGFSNHQSVDYNRTKILK